MVGVPPTCALLGGLAIVVQVSLLQQHSANAKCRRVLVLDPGLVLQLRFWGHGVCSSDPSLRRLSYIMHPACTTPLPFSGVPKLQRGRDEADPRGFAVRRVRVCIFNGNGYLRDTHRHNET